MAHDRVIVPETAWFKSSYSGGNETECVECAPAGDRVLIRDSKDRDGGTLGIRAPAWRAFIHCLSGLSDAVSMERDLSGRFA